MNAKLNLKGAVVALGATLCVLCLPLAQAVSLPSTQVAWVPAASHAEVDRAFALAKAQRKPVLLYWGATWCPPCNQLKATLFRSQDFAALAREMVVVHVDGDRPGAQQLGARFQVRGYPTVVMLNADGAELSRLPGEAEAEQVLAVMRLGLSGGRAVREVWADALAGRALSTSEWKQLAYYAWGVDEARLAPAGRTGAALAELAARVPSTQPELATRLWLTALSFSDAGSGVKPDAALNERVAAVLREPAAVKRHLDVLLGGAAKITQALSDDGSPERAPWVARFEGALRGALGDASLSRADRTLVLLERVALARLGQGKELLLPVLPEALVAEVREHAQRMDREITDGFERQAVITAVASLLGRAGLWADSDALLKANLARSHSPYYLMSQLGGNARRQGRTAEALDWYRQSHEKSVGPATRLQWGSSHLQALVELAPTEHGRIEAVASQLIRESGQDSGAFFERSARSMQRAGTALQKWAAADPAAAAVLKRLSGQLAKVCAQQPTQQGQRSTCEAVLKG